MGRLGGEIGWGDWVGRLGGEIGEIGWRESFMVFGRERDGLQARRRREGCVRLWLLRSGVMSRSVQSKKVDGEIHW